MIFIAYFTSHVWWQASYKPPFIIIESNHCIPFSFILVFFFVAIQTLLSTHFQPKLHSSRPNILEIYNIYCTFSRHSVMKAHMDVKGVLLPTFVSRTWFSRYTHTHTPPIPSKVLIGGKLQKQNQTKQCNQT